VTDEPRRSGFLRDPEQGINYLYELVKWVRPYLQQGMQFEIRIKPLTRNLEQNAKFHAMLGDLANQALWMNKRHAVPAWKVLTVSGHAIATGEPTQMTVGLEGEVVNLRESTALMSVKRSASLISYVDAWGSSNGVEWSDPGED
jgi:hypothetical protein